MSLGAATSLVIQDEEVVAFFFTLNDNYSFNEIEGWTFFKPQPTI